jgi:hypothetical protein
LIATGIGRDAPIRTVLAGEILSVSGIGRATKASSMSISNTSHEDQSYHSYLLRIWRENGRGTSAWRASLQSVQNQQMIRFRTLAELCDYLIKEFSESEGKEGEL